MILSRLVLVARAAAKPCGLALILAALATPALAFDPEPVPEIDPGSLGSALTLLIGGALILTNRLRRR
jgi:hypothetical protein